MVGDRNRWVSPITGEELSDNVYHLKSLLWPGFHLFRTSKDHFSLYVGHGNKYHTGTFYPRFEYEIQADMDDQPVQFEVSKQVESKIDDDANLDDDS